MSRRSPTRLEALTASALAELHADGFTGEPILLRSIDMRYAGQNYEREVPLPPGPFTAAVAEQTVANFGRAHDDFYGFSLEDEPVEFVNLRVSAIGPTDLQTAVQLPETPEVEPVAWRPVSFRGQSYLETPVYRRESLGAGFTLCRARDRRGA